MRPTGTVTLLFSDIDGSIRLLRSIGVQRYENALAQHRLLLRDAFASHGGYEVDTAGDSFFSSHSLMRWMLCRPRWMHSARSPGTHGRTARPFGRGWEFIRAK